MIRVLICLCLHLLSACEGTTPTVLRSLHSTENALTPPSIILVRARSARLPKPPKGAPTADINFAIAYAQNGINFIDNLVSQFQSNILTAVSDGYLTIAEGEQILKRAARQQRRIEKAFTAYINKLNRRRFISTLPTRSNSVQVRAISIKFNSPYGPPIRKIPGFSKPERLKSLRTMLGQMESFSGLAISFINSLTEQITVGASSSQIQIASRLETKLVRGLSKDIRGIKSLIKLINIRRFKRANRGKIDPETFVGEYTGTCTNISNGAVESIGATIAYNPDSKEITLSFNRPGNIFGAASPEIFSDTFTRNTGLRFDQDLEKFGAVSLSLSPKGFIAGHIITDPVSSVDRVDFWGTARKSDRMLLIDIRVDFQSYSEGGQAHAVLALSRK